jgi:hypothetical protein
MRLAVRLAIVTTTVTAMAVLVMIVRSRQAVEVWHMAADPPSGGE